MDKTDIQKTLENKSFLKEKLFCRGFLITNDSNIDADAYPFYGLWKKTCFQQNALQIYTHTKLTYYFRELPGGTVIGLLGHAYNPFRSCLEEQEILRQLAEVLEDREAFFRIVNELTGVFALFAADSGGIRFLADPVGLMSVFYTQRDGNYYISSHSNLIGDLLDLEVDDYIHRLQRYRYFHLFGNQLPGNISQFTEVSRLVPNHMVRMGKVVEEQRFYHPHSLNLKEEEILNRLSELMQSSMDLISRKWKKPAISLTGGCDSRTTLACASGIYEKFAYFSYDSQPNEAPDADAAAAICKKLGLPFTRYDIPYKDDSFEHIEDIRRILAWNCGNVCPNNKNDVRKRAFLDELPDFDVEVKSWASEVGRSRYTKRYHGRRNFGKKPTPRKCTTFYKFLFFDRGLVRSTDAVFRDYLRKFFEASPVNPIPWQDQFYWEWHWPSRDGITLTSEHRYSSEMTVPYNNRRILELLLSMPEEDRVNDRIYTLLRQKLDPAIDTACDSVVDVNHTSRRALAEDFYYIVNQLIP